MSIYQPPNYLEPITIFNPANWEDAIISGSGGGGGVDIAYLNANYLKYPSAQGDETFTQLNVFTDLSVGGSAVMNNISATTSSVAVSLYPTTTTGDINIGTALVAGRLKIGTTTNSNHIGNCDITGATINNTTTTTGNLNICNNQTSGVLNLGTNANRTSAINIGNGTSNSGTISIGAVNSTVAITGSTITLNGVNQLTANSITYTTFFAGILANNLPSPYFVVFNSGATANNVGLPLLPYLGQRVIIYNSTTTTLTSTISASTAIIVPTGLTVGTPVNTIYCITGDCITVQFNGNYWFQLNKPNTNTVATTIAYTSFTPSSYNQIGYFVNFSATQVASATVATFTFSQQITGTLPAGLYFISLVNKIVAGTTAGNILNAINTGLSTGGTVATELANFATNIYPNNITMLANGIITTTCFGIYTYTSGANPYNTTSYTISTVAGTGVVCSMYMQIMRIA